MTEKATSSPAAQSDGSELDAYLLAWAVVNCHMLARRALAQGVLRASVPREVTDGERESASSQNAEAPPSEEAVSVGAHHSSSSVRTPQAVAAQIVPTLWSVIYDAAANNGTILHDDTVTAIEEQVGEAIASALTDLAGQRDAARLRTVNAVTVTEELQARIATLEAALTEAQQARDAALNELAQNNAALHEAAEHLQALKGEVIAARAEAERGRVQCVAPRAAHGFGAR